MKTEEYIQAIFNGETLTEEFKEKVQILFETAVSARVAEIEQTLITASANVIKEETEKNITSGLEYMSTAVDGYLTEVSKEWLKENQVEVERGLRTEIAENFISGLKELFENSYVEIPKEKIDLVDDLFEQNNKLENSLNEIINQNIQLKSNLIGQLCAEQFALVSEGLTDTETEKLAKLAENLDFESVEQYAEKVKLLKESYFGAESKTNGPVDVSGSSPAPSPNPLMEGYVAAISRQLKISGKRN
jgi:anti-anti-sigma regulatory factor